MLIFHVQGIINNDCTFSYLGYLVMLFLGNGVYINQETVNHFVVRYILRQNNSEIERHSYL